MRVCFIIIIFPLISLATFANHELRSVSGVELKCSEAVFKASKKFIRKKNGTWYQADPINKALAPFWHSLATHQYFSKVAEFLNSTDSDAFDGRKIMASNKKFFYTTFKLLFQYQKAFLSECVKGFTFIERECHRYLKHKILLDKCVSNKLIVHQEHLTKYFN
jgi:hypothetical protein